MPEQRLRVALILDRDKLRVWHQQLLQRLETLGQHDLSVLLLKGGPSAAGSGTPLSVPVRLLWSLQNQFLGGSTPENSPLSTLSELDVQTPLLELGVAGCAEETYDVVVDLSESPHSPATAMAGPGGVWTIEVGDQRPWASLPPAYWEVMLALPTTASSLLVALEGDRKRVARESFASTNHMSFVDNASPIYLKSSFFVDDALLELGRVGLDGFRERILACRPADPSRQGRTPTSAGLVRMLALKLCKKAARKLRQIVLKRQWFLMYTTNDMPETRFSRFRPIYPPRNTIWADPFVVVHEGQPFVFYEEAKGDGRGRICVGVLVDGQLSDCRRVLEEQYHMSYPYVFRHGEDLYMVPETRENRTVSLYRCRRFPDDWVFAGDLLAGGQFVDSTLFEYEGKWWLFTTRLRCAGTSSADELFAYYSDDPTSGDWSPHPQNPVMSDVRIARSAGRVFQHDGRLIRPSQDCSTEYGGALNWNEIIELTPESYRECLLEKFEPTWSPLVDGLHTYNFDGDTIFIDARRWIPKGV